MFTGFFYIFVGMLLSKKTFDLRMASVMFCVSYVLNVAVTHTLISSFLVPIGAVGLFYIVKEINLADLQIYPFLRKMSMVIYFIHMYVWTVYCTIVYGTMKVGMATFVAVSGITLVIAMLYAGFITKLKTRNISKRRI